MQLDESPTQEEPPSMAILLGALGKLGETVPKDTPCVLEKCYDSLIKRSQFEIKGSRHSVLPPLTDDPYVGNNPQVHGVEKKREQMADIARVCLEEASRPMEERVKIRLGESIDQGHKLVSGQLLSFLNGVISIGFTLHLGPSKEVLGVGCDNQKIKASDLSMLSLFLLAIIRNQDFSEALKDVGIKNVENNGLS
uniref:Uncharacterized protein n=1 Tax=Cucumis melo TaxID=3656 RepID=A0A9I9E871_CUCME